MTNLGHLRRQELRVPAVARRGLVARSLRPRLADVVGAGMIALLLAAHLLSHIGAFVTGNDPGNWLAAGREMWETPASGGFARPLVPTLAVALSALFGPLEALRALAVGSLVAVPLAVYAVLRPAVTLPVAIAAALFVGLGRPVVETVAFGGYPQNVALAAAVVATVFTSRQLQAPTQRDRAALAASLIVAALAHHIYFLLAVAACAVVAAVQLVGPDRKLVRRHVSSLLLPLLLAVVAFVPTAAALAARGYEPVPGLEPIGREAALAYMFGDARPLYAGLIALAATWSVFGLRTTRSAVLHAGSGMLAVAAFAFTLFGEPRVLPMLFVGAVLSAATFCEAMRVGVRRGRARSLVVGLPVAVILACVPRFTGANTQVFDYYRVLNRDLTEAAQAVDDDSTPGAVAVVKGQDGWPLGWWFEGLGRRAVRTGSDLRWLAFPGERRTAALIDQLTAPGATSHEARSLASVHGIDLLVADQGTWPGWKRWLREASPAVETAFANDRYIILRFLHPEADR